MYFFFKMHRFIQFKWKTDICKTDWTLDSKGFLMKSIIDL